MKRMIAVVFAGAFLAGQTAPAHALEAYSSQQQRQFTDWCMQSGQQESACSCTLKRLATTVPPAALTAFLADKQGGGSGFSVNTATITTAALVTDALTACSK